MNRSRGIWLGVGGLLLGTVAGLLFAPQSGRRTRSLIRDKAIKYSNDATDFADKKSRHLANKVRGYAHEVKEVLSDRIVKRETAGVGSEEEITQT